MKTNTKTKLLTGLAIGAILFYLYAKTKYGKKECGCKEKKSKSQVEPKPLSQKDSEKMERCSEKIAIKMSMMRFTGTEAKENFRKKKLEECMNKSCT